LLPVIVAIVVVSVLPTVLHVYRGWRRGDSNP
jgi:hypothetical protein